MYIYTITNKINGKIYVGQTVQSKPKMRWYAHVRMVRANKKNHLYDSMRKHGIDQFEWKIVDTAKNLDDLNHLETFWAEKYRQQGITLYNNRQTGNNKTHSEASIAKMRQVHLIRHATNKIGGWKRRDGGPMLGKKHSKVSCLYCHKEIGVNILFRSHGDKCKGAV